MVCLLGISVLIISASPGRIYIWNYASQNRLFSAVRVNFALTRTLDISEILTILWISLAWFTRSTQPVLARVLSTLMTSTSTYVPSGLSTSTSTEIRYSSTTSMSTKYSGPNPVHNKVNIQWADEFGKLVNQVEAGPIFSGHLIPYLFFPDKSQYHSRSRTSGHYQVDCLALICVNHAFLRMVRKYELITHFPVVYADLRAVPKFAMILVWCPACTPVRLHHSPWAGASLGFLVRKKTRDHCSSPRLLLSTNRVIKCRYLVNHTGIYLYIWGSVLAQLFYVLCSVIMCLLTSWWTNIVRHLIQMQFSYLIYWFSHVNYTVYL